MTYLEAVLYGLMQGATEYLPISSSAHLLLLPYFLGQKDPGLTFDVLLHLGTLFSTLIYFWKDWVSIFRHEPIFAKIIPSFFAKSLEKKTKGYKSEVTFRHLVIATIPAVIAGALLHSYVETVLRGVEVVVITLSVGGVILWAIDRYCSRQRDLKLLTIKNAWWIGVAQCFALIPGVSRSGATISWGRYLGFTRQAAARFSFMMLAPVTFAAVVYELKNYHQLFENQLGVGQLWVAFLSSFLSGCLAIKLLLYVVQRWSYVGFAVYRVLLAAIVFYLFI